MRHPKTNRFREEYNPAFPEVGVKRKVLRSAALLLALCITVVALAQTSAPVSAQVTMIRAGSLIDGTSNSARRNVIITILGNTITDVADGSAFSSDRKSTRLNSSHLGISYAA